MNRLTGRSWQHLLLVLTLAVSLSVAGAVAAQDEDAGAPEAAEEARADAAEDWGADDKVWNMMADWKATDPVGIIYQEKHANGDLSLVESIEPASLRTDEKRWGKSRSLTYTKAFIGAINQYVSQDRKRISSQILRDYFAEDLDESEFVYQLGESTNDVVSRVATKALTLGERNLDQALLETGMSAEEIERMTPPQKKAEFSDRLSRQVTVEAFGSAAGLTPVKTFEAYDDEGNSAIGLVAVVSRRTKNLADDIAANRPMRPEAEQARTSIAKQIGALSDEDLAYQFGPRVWWDERGYPTIVAFGQWAWSPQGLDKRKKARRRAFALKQASSDADSHLATFINTSTRFSKVSDQGDEAEEFSLVSRDGTVGEQDVRKISDRVVEESRVNSTVTLTGLKVLRQWFSPHPDVEGHELVGVVVSWSPAQEDRVRAELGKKPKHQPPAEKAVQKTSVSSGTAESRDLMDPADF